MPKNSIISEGNTTNEAIENGLKILNVSKNMVNVKVLENEQKRSFFSILAPRVVKVELTLKEESEREESEEKVHEKHIKKEKQPVSNENIEKAEENVKVFLDTFLKQLGNDTKYDIKKDNYGLEVTIEGEDAAILIGYRGETLYALQTLISSVAGKNLDEKIRVLLDIGNYKEKREKTLENLPQDETNSSAVQQTMEMRLVSAEHFRAHQVPFLNNPLKRYCHSDCELDPYPYISARDLTMIVVPVVGFDSQGNRLGYGAGNYDRYLTQISKEATNNQGIICRVVGVAFAEQQVEDVPTEEHDIPLAIVAL